MNGNKLFVDTNICIYLLNDDHIIADLLDGAPIYISFITEIELYAYHSHNPLAKAILDDFIESVNVVNIDNHIKAKTIEIRRDLKLKLPDSIIAASALLENISFITADKGFKKVPNLDIVLYDPASI
jgi:predicted nucleic acid-binding protein